METQNIDERARLREADRLIEEIVGKLREHKDLVARSLAFGRVSWHGKDGRREVHIDLRL